MKSLMMFMLLVAGVSSASGQAIAGDEKAPQESIAWSDVQLAEVTDGDETNDPLEPLNRVIFEFNETLQDVVFRPVGSAYNTAVPQPVRTGVGNFLDNVNSPVTLVNDFLQGNVDNAMRTIGRFLVNTVVGIGGISDVASDLGMEDHKEDFGQTLAFWGMGEGFYLVLPIFGPSNPRDAIGQFLIDGYFDAAGMWVSNTGNTNLQWSRKGLDGVDSYAEVMDELEEIKKTSVDYYAAIRSMYRQKRASEISNGSIDNLPPIPNLSYAIESSSKSP